MAICSSSFTCDGAAAREPPRVVLGVVLGAAAAAAAATASALALMRISCESVLCGREEDASAVGGGRNSAGSEKGTGVSAAPAACRI
jgi:hypothetical protein